MKDYEVYKIQLQQLLGNQLKGAITSEVNGCMVIRNVPSLFANAVARILSPLNVYVDENNGKCVVVANAKTWGELSEVLKVL